MSEAELYTADVLETWLRHGLQHGPRSVRGDWQQRHATRQAAVLVGIVPRTEPMLLLTRRAEHLPKHPGQIAFPGGAVDATDADAIATALREAEEEVGLDAALVRPLGLLPPYITITQFNVTPVLALLDPQYRARACPDEVAEVFELPLLELLDTGRYEWRRIERNGRTGQSLFIECAGRTVWGATAGMLVQLAVLLGREEVVLPDQSLQQKP
ncbi:CoA pyrophosphatase [Chitinilyticum piscinae]|uniref:CoA pyrophosphatase n=1 Tax=Chitinilyticum piscinae TaxID=2866724 RepID=A0A8J7KGW1_9NEIS|nr:CoA pyrophosphatase [Chitinilyticum piscinae]MBE9610779.1 CoA pyrophosphatase [Chitinilyticum piscinae]